MIIRKFRRSDAEEVCRMVKRTFSRFVAPDFARGGIKKWLEQQTPQKQIERAAARDVYVAVIGNKIVGMIEAAENKRISRLFVDRRYHRRGIARNLAIKIEMLFRKRGIKLIRVYSSGFAREFYERMGYRKSRGAVRKDGMVYYPMNKIL